MKPEAQRIAIAEACGWTDMARTDKSGYYHGCLMGNHDYGHLQPVPDYLNDLNAMHEAEKVLDADQCAEYVKQSAKHHPTFCISVLDARDPNDWEYEHFHLIHATATQRAEAFLRTLGLWVE